MSKATKTKLTVYLLKESCSSPEDAVEHYDFVQPSGSTGRLFSKSSMTKNPVWASTFFGAHGMFDHLFSASVSAVFVRGIEVAPGVTRYFALTFGYGAYMLDRAFVEERFGLKVVLNSIDENSVRKVKTTTVAGVPSKSSEQMPIRSSIANFSLDIETDLLDGVTGIGPDDALITGIVSGADSLSFTTELGVDEIGGLLSSLYEVYESQVYKEHFAWVDHISDVKDVDLIQELECIALRAITHGDNSFWMAVPKMIEWERMAGIRYPGSAEVHEDILAETFLGGLKRPLVDFDSLRKLRFSLLDAVSGRPVESWAANRCLFGEVQHKGSQYCISEGKWYVIEEDYSRQINQNYESTELSSIGYLPYGSSSSEGDYNSRLADSDPSNLRLLDAKLVSYGGGYSRIEVCDVLTKGGTLIHIKRYSGSSTLSHLFNQALVAADLIKSDRGFVAAANVALGLLSEDEGFRLAPTAVNEVAFGIISKGGEVRPKIPFFARVAFCHVKKRLEAMGIKVTVRSIPLS